MSEHQTPPEDEFINAESSAGSPPEAIGAFTKGNWRAVSTGDKESGEAKSSDVSTEAALRDELGLILNAETLIVLAGSGTSLEITQPDGSSRAPSMKALWNDVSNLPEFSPIEKMFAGDLVEKGNLEHVLSYAQAQLALTGDNSDLANFVAAAEAKVLERCSFIDGDSNL